MNIFYNLLLSYCIVIVTSLSSFSQTYSIIPNDTLEMVGLMEDLAILNIEQHNISATAIGLKWQKISESVPAAWDISVCDNVFCYTALMDSGTMNPVAPGDFGILQVHVTPHVNFGTAVVRYSVWDSALPALRDTLTFIYTVYDPTGISHHDAGDFNVYPNPAQGEINIVSHLLTDFNYVITDVSGKEVFSGNGNSNYTNIKVDELPNGIFTLSFFNGIKPAGIQKLVIQR